jgi:biotin carboxyl carrier protein
VPDPDRATPADTQPSAGSAAAAGLPPAAGAPRTASERAADHRAVERLASQLLPALMARLASSGLAELEVREGSWKVRLRRPLELGGAPRLAAERHGRLQPGTASGSATGAPLGAHAGSTRAPAAGAAGGGELLGGWSDAPGARGAPGHPGHEAGRGDGPDDGRPDHRADRPTVTSPAVGIFRPRSGISGSDVRAGDRLGAVDVLGIPQEIVTPVDGLVGEILAEPGDAVEYGQPLFAIRASLPERSGEAIPVDEEDALAAPAGERA